DAQRGGCRAQPAERGAGRGTQAARGAAAGEPVATPRGTHISPPRAAMTFALLAGVGLVAGAAGTPIGPGGGFLLAPRLVVGGPPAVPPAISLTGVCLNASSGTLAYARMGRADWRSAWPFALASMPGAVLGEIVTRHMARRVYEPLLGFGLLGIALLVILR